MVINQNHPKQLIIIISLLIVLTLVSTHIGILLLYLIAALVMLYCSSVWQAMLHRLMLIHLFIFLGVLPLLFERTSNTDDVLLHLWSSWTVSPRTVALALSVFLRASVTSLWVALLLHYIPFYILCQNLRSWGLPKLLVELIELSYRYIYLLLEQGQHIYQAQLLRQGYQGYTARYQHTSQLFARSFVLAHSEGEKMYDGLLTRHFETMEVSTVCSSSERIYNEKHSLLRLEGISYSYNRDTVKTLKQLSLDIGKGERIVLLGANGAGKSTLMRVLSGLISDYDGTLSWYDGDVAKNSKSLRQQRKRVAFVMQNANHQLFCPSVEDEIAFGLRNSGLSDEELRLRVEEIIDCYELQSLRAVAPHLLSEGQKKWVSIAAVMALSPEIILLDEPTAFLDHYYTQKVLSLVNRYADSGCSVIISTHDMNLAYTWATRALVLTEGTLKYDGNLDTLFGGTYNLDAMKIAYPYGYDPVYNTQPALTEADDTDYCLGLFHRATTTTALIYGWGNGAQRKALTLCKAGIKTCVVAPELNTEDSHDYHELATNRHLMFISGKYASHKELIKEHTIIVAATGIASIDADICNEAARYGRMYCSLSNASLGNIQFAALLDKLGLHIAIHSTYRLPELTQSLRDLAAEYITSELADELIQMSELRKTGQVEEYARRREQFVHRLFPEK